MKFIAMPDPDDWLYDFRTMVECVNRRFKEKFGRMFVRVYCEIKAKCHLMFVILAFAIDHCIPPLGVQAGCECARRQPRANQPV